MNHSVYKPDYPVDLHCHTTRSDGGDSPQELIENAALLGMKAIAITDHDIRPPEKIFLTDSRTPAFPDGSSVSPEDYAAALGMVLFPGIEISCDTFVDDCHIVCFKCPWEDPFFDTLEADVAASKTESYRKLTEALTAFGMPLSWNEVLDNNQHPIAENKVQKKMIFELMARKGYVPDWSAGKRLVADTPELNIPRRKPDPVEIIHRIHAMGGVCILAHPYLIAEQVTAAQQHSRDRSMSRKEYINMLFDAGLYGIEASYTYDKTTYNGSMSKEEIEREVIELYGARAGFLSGGSDYHADEKKGQKKIRRIGECGIDRIPVF